MQMHIEIHTYIQGLLPKGPAVTLHVLAQKQRRQLKALSDKVQPLLFLSFTGQLAVEAGKPYGKGLKCTQWVVVVQGEHIVCHTSKLHDYVVS